MAEWRGYNDVSVNLTVLINGTDYSANLGPGFVESTFIDSDNPQGKFWSGQITLTNTEARVVAGSLVAPINLDPTTNLDFERGNLIEVIANGNTLYFRVGNASVKSWGGDLVPSELEIEVVDKLGLVNQDFPSRPVFGFNVTVTSARQKPGASVSTFSQISTGYSTWLKAVESELLAPKDSNGDPILTAADFDLAAPTTLNGVYVGTDPKPDGFTAQQNRGKNPYENAAQIASARGYALYCDPADEKIKVIRYPLLSTESSLVARVAAAQMLEFTPSLVPLEVNPVDSVEATTFSVQVARPVEDGGNEEDMVIYPQTIAVAAAYSPGGSPIVVCERIVEEPRDGSTWSQRYRVRARSFWLFPKVPGNPTAFNTSTAWVTVCQGTISRAYNSQGLPIRNDDVQSIARGCSMDGDTPKSRLPPESEFYGDATLISGQGTRERFAYDSRGVPVERIKDVRGTLISLSLSDTPGDINTDITAVRILSSETETNTYNPDGRYTQIVSYSIAEMAITGNNDDTGLIPDPNQKPVARTIDGVPKPSSLRPATAPVAIEEYTSTEKVDSPIGKRRSVFQSVLGGTAAQHASARAKMILALKQQGALSYDCERAVGLVENFTPFLLEHVGRIAGIRDAERVEWSVGEMKLAYVLRECGKLAEPVEVPPRVIVIPSAVLIAGPMPDLT